MESQELRATPQQRVPTTFLSSLQMSINGHLLSMADVATYSNSIARLGDSVAGGGLALVRKCEDSSAMSGDGGSVALSRKSEENVHEETYRNLKRRKENADGHGILCHGPSSNMMPQSAVCYDEDTQQQQTFSQHCFPPNYRMYSRSENAQQHNSHVQMQQQAPSHVYSKFEDANGRYQSGNQSQDNMEHAQHGLHQQNQYQDNMEHSLHQNQTSLQRTSSDAQSITETVHRNSNRASLEAAGFSGNGRLAMEHSHGGGLSSSEVINSSSCSFHPSPSVNSQQTSTNASYSNGNQRLAIPLPVVSPELTSTVSTRRLAVKEWGNRPLSMVDPQLHSILEREKVRQWKGIELIASENFTSQAVMEVLGSHLTNKYSEGLPGARYYGGNEYIDQIENLCCERALIAFHLNPDQWGVNVQPYSCTSANFAVYTALLQPKDRIMGLDSPSGGHLSHGYYTSSGKKVSAASIFFENLSYKVNPETGYVDYVKLEEKAQDFRPKILICGGSAYPREWDYSRFRQIADKIGAVLMCDMAHISGLVAAKECASPFDYCDIVTSTMHKSLRGPRGGMIFYRKGLKQRRHLSGNFTDDSEHYDFEDRVNFAVFPSLQGGPHNNQIAALAVALKQVVTPEYKAYMQQVKKNAQALVAALQRRGCKLVTDGTDNHLLLWDLRPHGITGYRFEKICELCHITVNKNAVYGDSGNFAPGGVRLGTLAMTSRGCVESDFEVIAEFLLRVLNIAIATQREQSKQQRDFLKTLQNSKDITDLRNNVERFAATLAMPGFDI